MWQKLELPSKMSISYRYFLLYRYRHSCFRSQDVMTRRKQVKYGKEVIVLPLVVRIDRLQDIYLHMQCMINSRISGISVYFEIRT